MDVAAVGRRLHTGVLETQAANPGVEIERSTWLLPPQISMHCEAVVP